MNTAATIGTSSAPPSDTTEKLWVPTAFIDSLIDYGKKFIGQEYRYRGPSDWPMDCSGYLSHLYAHFHVGLPRSVGGIAQTVQRIEMSELRKGDLLFFKGQNLKNTRPGHVSMVINVTADTIIMLHSCWRGIRTDEYPQMEYYKRRFLFAGRLPAHAYKETDAVLPEGDDDGASVPSGIRGDSYSVMGVGDMMLGTNYPSSAYLPPNDGIDLLDPVKDILQNADVTFGNLEGGFLTRSGTSKTCRDTANSYSFKSPDHYVNYFKEAGFDLLSMANNHVNDFGVAGKNNSVRLLDECGIHHAGLTETPYTVYKREGVKFGFCAFSPNAGTQSINDIPGAEKIVRYLDSTCNIVIVSFHGGAEGASNTHVTRETETFLGENRGNPYRFARAVIDAGADIVFGHGPHVTRAIDLYKNKFIAYSLGNFATYGCFNLKTVCGIAPIINVHVDKNGGFLFANIYSTKQVERGGPIIDTARTVLRVMKDLTSVDFPETQLEISENGTVTKKDIRPSLGFGRQ